MKPRLPRLIFSLGKLVVTAAMLWLIFRSVGADSIAQALSSINALLLLPALGVLLLQFLIMAWRWKVLLRLLFGKEMPLGALALPIGQGMLASQALPATVGGDAYRMALVAGRIGAAAAVRSVVCDRLLALTILIALVVVLSPVMAWRLGPTAAVLSITAASACALSGLGAMIFLGQWIARLPVIGVPLAAVADDARHALFTGTGAGLASALGLVTHLSGVVLVYILALAVKTPLSPLDCLLIVPPVLLVSALPVSLGGWGLREGAFLAGFSMVGADPAGGVTVSILFGASGILLGVVCALIAPFVAAPSGDPEKL